MSDTGTNDSKSKPNNSIEDLRLLLSKQVEMYQQMVQLEEQLGRHVSDNAFARVSENTKQKAALMEKIIANDADIAPLIASHISEKGALPNADAENLRLKAIELVEKLQELEANNFDALKGFRDGMAENFRETKQAKRAAHGYRQSKSIYRSKHDTRR